MSPEDEIPVDGPINDLGDHTLESDPELLGRVRRSINRRVLAADTLDFSLKVLALTAWDYLKALLDVLPQSSPSDKESSDG